ncbi:MAG: C40 family peptidase [Clostridia bacterium]|nr:C40 family peptidase [Clostridia bacterium]
MKKGHALIKALSLTLAVIMLAASFPGAASATDDDDITGYWGDVPSVSSLLALDGSKATLTVYNAKMKGKNVICAIASYDGDGRITSVKTSVEAASSLNTFSADMPEDLSYVKSFVLGDSGEVLTKNRRCAPPFVLGVVGDSVITFHNPIDCLYAMAEKGGHALTVKSNSYNNVELTPDKSFSLYEYCSFSGSGNNLKAVSIKSAFYERITSKLDCLVLLVSRDRAFMSAYNEKRMTEAFRIIQSAYYAANPNGKIVLFAPMPYKDTQGDYGQYYGLTDLDARGHWDKISALADTLASIAEGRVTVARIGDAFLTLEEEYGPSGCELYESRGIYQNVAGAYYISCLLYAYIFDESPVGVNEYGFLNRSAAEFLQKEAHKYVFGEDAPEKARHEDAIPHEAFENCDPRTEKSRDERFKNEVYPEYFDELFATAYCFEAFGGAVQYDQTNIAKASGATRRLYQGISPSFITPQRIAHQDCTWFVHSVYNSAFDYVIKKSVGTYVIDITEGEAYRRTKDEIAADPEACIEAFLDALQPGDMIMYYNREGQKGHGMLYIGNGKMLHCSGGSHKTSATSDYSFSLKADNKELLGGITFSTVYGLADPSSSRYSFGGDREVSILRPLSLGIKPNADAVARAKNLKGVICWKESDRTAGATVNPGEDVTFTYKIRNDTMEEKVISLSDKLPAHTAFKSGDVKFTDGALSTNVTVPARSLVSLSFTVTVSPSAPEGKIPCGDTEIGGVKLYDYAPIYVARTLTESEQAAIANADVTATTDSELIAKTYAEIGKTVSLPEGAALSDRFFNISNGKVTFKDKSLIPQNLYGGSGYAGKEFERIRHIDVQNVSCGDVLIVLRNADAPETAQCWLCLGDGNLKTVENGAVKSVSNVTAATLFDSLFGQFAFIVIRPSFGF